MIVKLLTEHHFKFLSLKGCCRGSPESTLGEMSNCWKSHAAAQIISSIRVFLSCFRVIQMVQTVLGILEDNARQRIIVDELFQQNKRTNRKLLNSIL